MDDSQAALPLPPAAPSVETVALPRPVLPVWLAAVQVVAVCGIPTQIVVGVVLALGVRIPLLDANGISFEFISMVSLIDTALVAILIRIF